MRQPVSHYQRHRFPVKINGRKHWLWRAADRAGVVLDILVQARRHREASEAFLRRLVDGSGYQPRVVVTDNSPATGLSSGACSRASSTAGTEA